MLALLALVATILGASADLSLTRDSFLGSSGHGFGSGRDHFNSFDTNRHLFGNSFGSSFGSAFGSSFGNDGFSFERKKPEEEKGIGVCFIEIPTESVVDNPSVFLLGEGTRPGMSRVRSCCKDYTINPRNHLICDPICTKCRQNSYCVAPELCGCVPDLARNLDGYCVPTCPTSCQNGHCIKDQCQCNPGYQLDFLKKYCVPTCEQSCGSGNCTAPNTCA